MARCAWLPDCRLMTYSSKLNRARDERVKIVTASGYEVQDIAYWFSVGNCTIGILSPSS